jgi:hypothetical protein
MMCGTMHGPLCLDARGRKMALEFVPPIRFDYVPEEDVAGRGRQPERHRPEPLRICGGDFSAAPDELRQAPQLHSPHGRLKVGHLVWISLDTVIAIVVVPSISRILGHSFVIRQQHAAFTRGQKLRRIE